MSQSPSNFRRYYGRHAPVEKPRLVKTVWRDREGRLWSSTAAPRFSPRLHRDWWIEYLPGEWVSGRAPLFVRTMTSLPTNIQGRPDRQTWSVEAEGVRAMLVAVGLINNGRSLQLFWDLGGQVLSGMSSIPTTASTMVADRVRLVERLDRP